MASITIRNLEDDIKTRLRKRAAERGRSMEEEARLILAEAVAREAAPARGLGTALHELFKPFGERNWNCRRANRCGNHLASTRVTAMVVLDTMSSPS